MGGEEISLVVDGIMVSGVGGDLELENDEGVMRVAWCHFGNGA